MRPFNRPHSAKAEWNPIITNAGECKPKDFLTAAEKNIVGVQRLRGPRKAWDLCAGERFPYPACLRRAIRGLHTSLNTSMTSGRTTRKQKA